MPITYADTGVDIDATDAAKRNFAASVDRGDGRVLNRSGAFASLVEARFPGYTDPVLVFKTDEPGSKQRLALEHGRLDSLCRDLVNHLTNDVVCMGAEPLYVQDCIVCGRFDAAQVEALVAGIANACRELGCVLTGGETSVQPGVVHAGGYVLSASAIGVVERDRVVDGSAIRPGDVLLGLDADGPHTNGYTLIRRLLAEDPSLAHRDAGGIPFLEAVLRPHRPYVKTVRHLCGTGSVTGLAHITGGGIAGNLKRVLPPDCDAAVDLGLVEVPPVFSAIRRAGRVPVQDMLKTFNMGVGMVVCCRPAASENALRACTALGQGARPIGRVVAGSGAVHLEGSLDR